jgi:CheY-like chemotaxis protein
MNTDKVNCILIIDDDKAHRYLAERAIKEANIAHEYQMVKNGQEGINFIKSYRENHGICPSMIFLDMHMPVMDAQEFIEEYKRLDIQKRGKDGAIILMSELSPNAEQIRKTLGLKGHILKPLRKEDILENYQRFHKEISKGTSKDRG